MSEKGWTAEPWVAVPAFKGKLGQDVDHLIAFGSLHIAEVFTNQSKTEENGPAKANAVRIVACVNALADVPKPEGIPELVKELLERPESFAEADDVDRWHEKIDDLIRACGIKSNE